MLMLVLVNIGPRVETGLQISIHAGQTGLDFGNFRPAGVLKLFVAGLDFGKDVPHFHHLTPDLVKQPQKLGETVFQLE